MHRRRPWGILITLSDGAPTVLTVPQKSNFCVALHLEVAAVYNSTPHAAEICAPQLELCRNRLFLGFYRFINSFPGGLRPRRCGLQSGGHMVEGAVFQAAADPADSLKISPTPPPNRPAPGAAPSGGRRRA
jgi:hypothetical protein